MIQVRIVDSNSSEHTLFNQYQWKSSSCLASLKKRVLVWATCQGHCSRPTCGSGLQTPFVRKLDFRVGDRGGHSMNSRKHTPKSSTCRLGVAAVIAIVTYFRRAHKNGWGHPGGVQSESCNKASAVQPWAYTSTPGSNCKSNCTKSSGAFSSILRPPVSLQTEQTCLQTS